MSLAGPKRNKKVCYALAYRAPDYVRTRVLLSALSAIPSIQLFKATNSTTSAGRYPQTLWRLLKIRLRYRPDVYIIGFRGQEIYWPVRLLTFGKPLIFDEFINMHDWLGEENNKLPKFLLKIADSYEAAVLKTARLVLVDTKLAAEKSHQTYRTPLNKFRAIYVGADETIFNPQTRHSPKDIMEVFFYGNMAPLHGLDIILEAAALLADKPVHFTIIGGQGKPKEINFIRRFIKDNRLSNITHKQWIKFEDIPSAMAKSDLFLGGPFGGTSQAQRVITGKTFQALAVGTPVVVGEIQEQTGFRDKSNCLLTKQASPPALAEAISWALGHRGELEGIGKNGRSLYEQRFSTRIVAGELEKIINEVVR